MFLFFFIIKISIVIFALFLLSAVETIHRTWHLACDIIRSVLSGSAVRLWVTLIKLVFEDTEQAGDPVVQPHIQNELKEQGQSQTSNVKPNCLR